MLVMGSIIGSGVFKKVAPMTQNLGSEYLVLLAWVFAGIITLFGALTFAEIGSRIPHSGGMYAYLRVAYGDKLAFLYGWGCFAVMQSGSFASMSYVFAESVCTLFSLNSALAAKIAAVSTIWFLTLINYQGLKLGSLIQNVFTLGKILGIIFVVAAGLFYFKVPITPVMDIKSRSDIGVGLFFASMLSAFWAYDGIANIGYISEEIESPSKNIPKTLIFGVSAVIVLYFTINFSYFRILSIDQILKVANTKNSVFVIEAIRSLLGNLGALVMILFVCVSTFGCANGSILSSSRIYWAMSRDRLFFKSWGELHPTFLTPHRALIGQAIWGSILIFTGSFDELTDRLIFSSFIFYGLGAIALWRLRKRKVGNTYFTVPSLVTTLYALFCASLVAVTLWTQTNQALSGVLLIASGIPVYYYWKRRLRE
ncbi:MAG: hypothetical protein A4S09_07750 [Proteobacteria bacterium SG_bin7]|nr:MAG: hypothetical protein A4S09_07750 [Proteobacteria bacterium SG_bin7]